MHVANKASEQLDSELVLLTEVTVVELAGFDPDGGARAGVDTQTDHVVHFKVYKCR